VEAGKSNSHAGLGWEKLTYEIIRSLATRGDVCFVLWGKYAESYRAACEMSPVLCSAHPSPLSAKLGFFGSRPFSRVNELLRASGVQPINWRLP
jgi:uracil-DNA glycosylase